MFLRGRTFSALTGTRAGLAGDWTLSLAFVGVHLSSTDLRGKAARLKAR